MRKVERNKGERKRCTRCTAGCGLGSVVNRHCYIRLRAQAG